MSQPPQTDEELIADFKGMHAEIYGFECYSTNDLMRLQAAEQELARRGYTINEGYAPPVIEKETEDDE